MKILIAPDKFKGSLSAVEVCEAIGRALKKTDSALQFQSLPLADGGEGTAQLLTEHTKGKWVTCVVHNPLFRKGEAGYGISGNGTTAFIEMAAASGLQLLTQHERNPLKTSTVGTGELIADALHRGVKKIVLAIGGSATNDAGIGMASALGYRFYDNQNRVLHPVGENLELLHHIDLTTGNTRLAQTEVLVLCDVTNPLYGPNGAAYVFAPQKGATEQDVIRLDKGLQNFANVVKEQLQLSTDFAGAGAAGGLGAGAKVFLNASFTRGIDYVMQELNVEAVIREADVVITGEGKLDAQTLRGKVVAGITSIASRLNKPVIVIAGQNELSEAEWKQAGISLVISLVDENTSVEIAMKQTKDLIEQRVTEHLSLYLRSKK
ncbi:MAG TPA: glycerate kinase [Cyclobacteriaceae bacterium]|nr:glycerate kinase [Cytophagales bacterium]HNT50884.1 glycerate kinase [Cyclobacteriaceae bacterium]HRE66136.1 glycerate kinase [Cyclobacteriaceae bacterium]HRF32173.1 glycerate kinase [Cyclobacteriaceae bacterium]